LSISPKIFEKKRFLNMIFAISLLFFERVEGTMWIIRNRRSTNDRQSNDQKKKDKQWSTEPYTKN
jgi:hypothetical protein